MSQQPKQSEQQHPLVEIKDALSDFVAVESELAAAELKPAAKAAGMGTAFSTSLFGLSSSLILGFLDLQAGRAQNRFYTELENWLSSVTDVGPELQPVVDMAASSSTVSSS